MEYVDVGISGAKEKRPELDRLLTDAHRRSFDSVVVWRFDRFARWYLISFEPSKLSALSELNLFRFPNRWIRRRRQENWFSQS